MDHGSSITIIIIIVVIIVIIISVCLSHFKTEPSLLTLLRT
jgi:hypothetical protein